MVRDRPVVAMELYRKYVANRSMSVSVTFSDLERLDTMVILFGRISLIMIAPFDLERPNSAASHVKRGVFLGVSPYHKGRDPSATRFWGFLSVYERNAPFDAQLPHLTW